MAAATCTQSPEATVAESLEPCNPLEMMLDYTMVVRRWVHVAARHTLCSSDVLNATWASSNYAACVDLAADLLFTEAAP